MLKNHKRSTSTTSTADSSRLLGEQFRALEIRATNVVMAEITQRQRALANIWLALAQPCIDPRNALEMQAIAQGWFELVWSMQGKIMQSLINTLPAGRELTSHKPVQTGSFTPERRQTALLIPFPDRRGGRVQQADAAP